MESIPEGDERGVLYGMFADYRAWQAFDFDVFGLSQLPASMDDVRAMYKAREDNDYAVTPFVDLFQDWLYQSRSVLSEAAQQRLALAVDHGDEEAKADLDDQLSASFDEFRAEAAAFIPTRDPADASTGTYERHFPHRPY
ncbi:hypothetical protein ACIQWR_37845 [Streptomyces sp. NPDC098789]|uniref:hypothetical protein n=1 Tax=Streptomyces sp. NPDC098789 TaxID=3366098 RepID=UPI0037F71EFD